MYTRDGNIVTMQQITAAFEAGDAVLVHGYSDGGTSTCLMLDGQHYDTRDECYSVWEEVWTTNPISLAECVRHAK